MKITDEGTQNCTVILEVIGNVPGKKNSKVMIPRKGNQRPLLITKPSIRKYEKALVESFRLQLIFAIQTNAAGTSPTQQRQLLMRSLPQDDCWTQIPVVTLSGKLCNPGDEGATVTIQEITQ